MAPKYSEDERRTIASLFFLIHENLSLEEIRALLGNRIGKSTIARDKKGLKDKKPPSQKSTRAYAAVLDGGDTFDMGDPDELKAMVNSVISARRGYYDRQPLFRHYTNAEHKYPQKVMARILRSVEERQWQTVIDIIETFREGDSAQKFKTIDRYLEFYLGLAARNLGDPNAALKHFQAAYELTPDDTNDERDFLCHAAQNYALALQESPGARPSAEFIDRLLLVAVDCMPKGYPQTLVNVLVIASRLPEGYFGITAERVASFVRAPYFDIDLPSIRAKIMEQSELKELHENDMYQYVIAVLDEQIEAKKG